jgi:Cdc6-like AAA superfamily ATPase
MLEENIIAKFVFGKIFGVLVNISKWLQKNVPLYARLISLIHDFLNRVQDNVDKVHNAIKKNHFDTLLNKEFTKVKSDKKNIVLDHPALSDDIKAKIYNDFSKEYDYIYTSVASQFNEYYSVLEDFVLFWVRSFLLLSIALVSAYLAGTNLVMVPAVLFPTDKEFPPLNIFIFLSLSCLFGFIGLIEGYLGSTQPLEIALKMTNIFFMLRYSKFPLELNRLIRFTLRKIANQVYFSVSFDTMLDNVRVSGLEEGYDQSVEVDTSARQYTDKLISTMNHGTFGIAGPRGTGKTTLLRAAQDFKNSKKKNIYIYVSAPVVYNAREFILYLYLEVCHSIIRDLDPQGQEKPLNSEKWLPAYFLEKLIEIKNFVLIGFLALTIYFGGNYIWALWGNAFNFYNVTANAYQMVQYLIIAVLGTLLFISLCMWLVRLAVWLYYLFFPEQDIRNKTLKKSHQVLQKLKFQQTISYAKSGKLNTVVFQASSDNTSVLQEYEMALPEITNAYRKFISELATHYQLIIAIDEMDKIESHVHAQSFLNDLKNITNLDGCFYLISVSQDAMSAFELRGLPFRDAFDSTFDEVIQVKYLSLQQARDILMRRLIEYPEPFLQLVFSLSGGLPRDLIRFTRKTLMQKDTEDGGTDLKQIASNLLNRDLTQKLNAVRYQFHQQGLSISAGKLILGMDILENAMSVDLMIKTGKEFIENAKTSKANEDNENEFRAVILQIGIYLIYIATLKSFFCSDRTKEDFEKSANGTLDKLAMARQKIGLSSDYALLLINEVRIAFQLPVVTTTQF